MVTQQQFFNSEIRDISQVYSGRDRVCRCGCAGKYTATSYMINPRTEDIDNSLVAKRLKRAKRLVEGGAEVEYGDNHVNIVTGNDRALTFYFDEVRPKSSL